MKRALDVALSLSTMFGSPFDTSDIATHIISFCDAQSKYELHRTSHKLKELSSYNNLETILSRNPDALTEKEKSYALLWTTQRSHYNTVKKLLECGADPNADNRLHLSPLAIAQEKKDIQVIELLKKHKCVVSPHYKPLSPFVIAIYTRDTETLQLCIDHDKYDPNYTFNTPCDEQHPGCKGYNDNILHLATYIGDANILTILLAQPEISKKINQSSYDHFLYYTPYWIASDRNYIAFMETLAAHPNMNIHIANKQEGSAIGVATFYGHTNLVRLLTSHKKYKHDTIDAHGATPLFIAAQENHLEIAKIFIEDPYINVNYLYQKKITPLYVASKKGHTQMVKLLLKHPNIKTDLVKNPSPFYAACENGHLGCVKELYEANPNLINIDDQSSIYKAMQNKHLEIVRYLLKDKLVITSLTDDKGRTLLHLCATCDDPEIVTLLLNHSPYLLTICDYEGNSPLSYAAKKGNTAMVDILLKTEIVLKSDPNNYNKNNVTPLDVAANDEIKELIIKYGGKYR